MKWFLGILVAIILFPFFLILGLVDGVWNVYHAYFKAFKDTIER